MLRAIAMHAAATAPITGAMLTPLRKDHETPRYAARPRPKALRRNAAIPIR